MRSQRFEMLGALITGQPDAWHEKRSVGKEQVEI